MSVASFTFPRVMAVSVLLLGAASCTDFLPGVEGTESTEAGDGDGEDFEGEPGTCNGWKVSYCEAIEQCSAFATHEDCELDVGYVRCLEDAPVASCQEEIDQALADDDCDALPRDCTPQILADRTEPTRLCLEMYEALCEYDLFCGAPVSIETCVASLQASAPCSGFSAVLPPAEDCPAAVGRMACGDALPETCQGVLRY